ncbi:hypothetical protein OS493_037087 [Desmophyllum pertusum]|uniref:Uncharacterized protein n=1 Tax=Desmophyllum pertusum TaxID=174260 RepID=A0A9W9Z6G0_9CNID|nr:hypothetical protein OS493_037087 [Desmophyllum pertusum]
MKQLEKTGFKTTILKEKGKFFRENKGTCRKKMIAAEINKEWPLVEEVPSFRPHHNEEVQKLNEFVKRLSEGKESSKYTFEECGLGQNAIREIVLMQMRERRRGNKDRELHKNITESQEAKSDDSHNDTESVSDSSSNSLR